VEGRAESREQRTENREQRAEIRKKVTQTLCIVHKDYRLTQRVRDTQET
jgi:hypothetical protein